MPIFILAVVALAVFVAMGLMLFSATIAENRDRKKGSAAAKASVEEHEAKTRAAQA